MSEKIAFLEIKTLENLASFLDVNIKVIKYYCSDIQRDNKYISFQIAKKTGGSRNILAPNKQLKYIQKIISKELYTLYQPKKIANGFIIGRSIVSNANVHKSKRNVLNIDILDFFGTIHFGRVMGMFMNIPFCFEREIAKSLAQLVCHNKCLPQGAPTSPIISNFICRDLDNELIKLTSKYKILCTRYCDDITISTKASFLPEGIVYSNENGQSIIGRELEKIINDNSFFVNYKKTRLQSRKNRQVVTGIVVNEKLNIMKNKYKRFRAILHHTYCYNLDKAALKNGYVLTNGEPDQKSFDGYLKGTINYYKMVMGIHNTRYQTLAKKYNEIVGKTYFLIPDTLDTLINNYVYIVENEENSTQGTAFYVKQLGLITCLHNIWKIGEEVNNKKLNDILNNKITVYLPNNCKTKYNVTLIKQYENEDLVLLNIKYTNLQGGFELASKNINYTAGRSKYISIGYPNYSEGNEPDRMFDVKISAKTTWMKQTLYSVDKTFVQGSSGGPVLDQDHKVVGYIDRGNEFSGKPEYLSAFCPIGPLLSD